MPHPSQMLHGNLSKFGKRSSSVQSLIIRGLSLYMVRSQNVIQHLWEGNFVLFDKIPVSTIKLPKSRFQAFFDVSLFEKLIWKSRRPRDKTSLWGASPGISYKLRNKDAIGGWGWNIATQERKICGVEIEIVTFIINGSVKLTVPPSRSTEVNLGKKQKCCSLSCLWSRVQRDTSGPGYSQTLGCLLTKHHRCTCMWNWTETPTVSSRLRAKTVYKFCFIWEEKYVG